MPLRPRHVIENRDGTAAIEFSLLGSLFFLILLGHLDLGYAMFLQHRLDEATLQAARTIQLGAAQRGGDDTVQKFRDNRLCPALGSLMDCRRAVVDVGVMSDGAGLVDGRTWDRTPVGAMTGDSFCLGSAGEFAFLRVTYPQRSLIASLLSPALAGGAGEEEVLPLQSFAALRIEPVEARRTGTCR